jgi:chorismate synthase
MPGNSFGQLFRVTTFGESHGNAIGVIIDGCPAGLQVDMGLISQEMKRRRPGSSAITTQRQEEDEVEILSGVYRDITTGAPVCMVIRNKDQRPADYESMEDVLRPSHADFTYREKYGIRDHRGGGRSSARETAARVAAGALARMLLGESNIRIHAFVSAVGPVKLKASLQEIDPEKADENMVRCPDKETADEMIRYIEKVRAEGDSTGGIITCMVRNCPVGLGEPVFDKLHADLGKAMLSINAVKGFEIGSGFSSAAMRGSEHNDGFVMKEGKTGTRTNNSGGIQGGISNGEDINFNVAFKPVSTIAREQQTLTTEGEEITFSAKGRHDPCVVPRAVAIVEAMAALVLADHLLRSRTAKI